MVILKLIHILAFNIVSNNTQGGICGEKQWGIYIKIEGKLSKNWGKIEEKLIFPQPLGTIPLSPYKYHPDNTLQNWPYYKSFFSVRIQ